MKASDMTVKPVNTITFESLGLNIDADALLAIERDTPDEALTEVESDKWSPKEKGDQLRGFLMGSEPSEFKSGDGTFTSWWHFAAKDPVTGNMVPKRILGTAVLERLFSAIPSGTLCCVTFEGTTASKKGSDTRLFSVRALLKK